MSESIYVGIDLGGTSVKIGLCDAAGTLLHKHEGPTRANQSAEQVVADIAGYVREAVANAGKQWEHVAGVGAGIAGMIDMSTGIVKLAANLGWKNVAVKELLETALEKPVKIDNDANVAALGEAWSGAGAGVANVVCFTLGTGVGGGLIMNEKLYLGFHGMAGEIGHLPMVMDGGRSCGCGQTGCLETIASATGIIRSAKEAVERGEQTSMSQTDISSAKVVFDAAKAGDAVALKIVEEAAYYLGRAMALLTAVLDAQRFVVGGGVSLAGDLLFNSIRTVYSKYTTPALQENVEIVPAQLGNDAGVIGAAGLFIKG